MAILSTATSVVDYLKSKGFQPTAGEQFPLFNQRSSYYSALGLNSSLGEFTGSASQNTALLNRLQQQEQFSGVSISPDNIMRVIQLGQPAQSTASSVTIQGDTATSTQSSHQYNAVTGQLNPNYVNPNQPTGGTPTPTPAPTPTPISTPTPTPTPTTPQAGTYTGVSIVDYLSSIGKPSDYASRAKLAQQYGITNYTGTAAQNTQLLNTLRGGGQQAVPNAGTSGLTPVSPVTPPVTIQGDTATVTQPDHQFNAVTGKPNPSYVAPLVTPGTTPPITPGTTPTTPQDFSGIFKTLSAEELAQQALDMVTGSATFPLQQEDIAQEKAQLAIEGQRKTEEFIIGLASKGLIFSGKKGAGISQIDADTLASQLGIDRKYALLLATGLESAAQKVAKQAQEGNQMALTSLRSLGYDVNPITGQIEQTQTAKSAEATQARFEESQAATQARFEESQVATEARFQATQERILANQSGALSPQDISQVSAYAQYVIKGTDQVGNVFALTNVPEKYRGNVAVALLNAEAEANKPRNYTDEEIRTIVRTNASLGLNRVIQEIQSSPTLANKDRAILIANELLKKEQAQKTATGILKYVFGGPGAITGGLGF
jgi:hypothetical protein